MPNPFRKIVIQNYVNLSRKKIVEQVDVFWTPAQWDVLIYDEVQKWFVFQQIWALNYKWVWDADSNDPTLASWVWVKWDYYKVSVKWTTTIDWISDREVGDLIVFNWANRQRIAWWDAYVDLTDAQTIWWVKTFISSPIVPTPANPTDASNKNYTDSQAVAMSIALG